MAVKLLNGQHPLKTEKERKDLNCTELELSQHLIHNTPHHWSTQGSACIYLHMKLVIFSNKHSCTHHPKQKLEI